MGAKLVWKRFLRLLHEVYGSRVYKWGAVMWVDIKGEVQIMEKKRLTLHYIEEVNMLRKCHHVCLLT